jgi:glycosyltransferase involved in cell wall biosynthesis
MRILIFNWQDWKNPLSGGAEVHLHEIFSRVAKLGHEVTLFCSSFDGAPSEEVVDGIRVIREGGRSLFNFHVVWRYLLRFRRRQYDVVIDDMNKIPFYTPLYVREPLAVIVHHFFAESIFKEVPFPVALYVYLAENLGAAICRWKRACMLVVSPSTQKELVEREFRSEDIEYAYNCVDHDVHYPSGVPRSPVPLVGYFGRLKKYKSADHLLRAFVIARKEIPDLKLVFIGEGDHRLALERLAHELGVRADVRFTGFVSEEEKVKRLQEVWFTVNTSAKEGFGLTVIEANACGTPVVGSDVPGLRDAIRDNETGLLYEYGNIDDLVQKIVMLARDQLLRDRLSRNAITWARTFDWNVVARRTVELLEHLVRERRWR